MYKLEDSKLSQNYKFSSKFKDSGNCYYVGWSNAKAVAAKCLLLLRNFTASSLT